MFAAKLESYGAHLALVLEDGRSITYEQLAQYADAVFASAQLPPRTLIAIECENAAASVIAYVGALRNNYPALLIDASLDALLRKQLYQHFHIPYIHDREGNWISRNVPSPKIHPDVGILLSTSGSTGSPKLVRLTSGNLEANANSIASYLKLDERERPLTSLPIHYSYGLSVLNSHLLVGATVVLTAQPVTARKFWDVFRDYDATSLAGVPTTYTMLKQLRFDRLALPTLRTMTQAGGRLSPDLIRWFNELARSRGQRFFVMYGQTEATARISYVPVEKLQEKIGSIGIAIPGGRLEIVDDNGNIVRSPNETGELRYTGPNVMMGYANTVEDLATSDTQGGVLRTGDLATCDEAGFFYVVGRIKRFIKVFGNRIDLDDIEAQLREEDYEVAVTGRDDLLVIAIRSKEENIREQLTAHLNMRYHIHHSAITVHTVESFPMSTSGKIQYAQLLKTLSP